MICLRHPHATRAQWFDRVAKVSSRIDSSCVSQPHRVRISATCVGFVFASGEAKGLSKLHYIFSKQKLMKRVWFVRSSVVMTAPSIVLDGIGKHVPSETLGSSMEMSPPGPPALQDRHTGMKTKHAFVQLHEDHLVTNSLVLEPNR